MSALELTPAVWKAIGWSGNVLFFTRFVVQWWQSEKAGQPVAPPSFWWLSLWGTLLLGAYTYTEGEPVLLCSYLVNGVVYARNLWLSRPAGTVRRLNPATAAALGTIAAALLLYSGGFEPRDGLGESPIWVTVGAVGAALWSLRFLLQWWASERAGYSHFPASFWWTSLIANALLLAYTLHLANPIFVFGYLPGPLVQVRNLMLGRGLLRTVRAS